LYELLVCDRIKTTLSENCLKYILSIGSSRDDGWLTVKDLTESTDRFVAAKSDAFKPRAYAIRQTPYKPIQNHILILEGLRHRVIPRNQGQMPPNQPQNVTTKPRKQITCYECGRPGHVRSSCPGLKKPASSVLHARSKRAAVSESSSNASIMPAAGGKLEDKRSASAPVSMTVSGATNT